MAKDEAARKAEQQRMLELQEAEMEADRKRREADANAKKLDGPKKGK